MRRARVPVVVSIHETGAEHGPFRWENIVSDYSFHSSILPSRFLDIRHIPACEE